MIQKLDGIKIKVWKVFNTVYPDAVGTVPEKTDLRRDN